MPGLDPGFTSLPYRALGDAALQRARDLGASHADFRFERVRYQDVRVRDGALQGAADDEDLGFAVRVIHGGAWGFASGVHLTVDEAVRVAESAVAVAEGLRRDDRGPGRDRAGAGLRRRHLGLVVRRQDPFDVPVADKTAVLLDWTDRLRRPSGGRTTRRPSCCRCARTSTTPTSPAPVRPSSASGCCPTFTAMGSDDERGIFDDMSSIAPPAGRGWEYVVGSAADGAWDWDAELAEVPELLAEKLAAPTRRGRHLRPGHPPVEPLADHPRVDRPRHRARPGARLRGQLRRHVVRDHRPARHAAVRLAGHARHRRPHRRARPRHHRLRRRGGRHPELGHRPRRRAGRLPARPPDGARCIPSSTTAAPTAAPTPTPPATSRSSGWRTSRCSPAPTTLRPRT